MSATLTYPVKSLKREQIICEGKLVLAADASVTSTSGIIASSAAPSSGVYALTLTKKFPAGSHAICQMFGATPIVCYPWITATDLTAGTMSVKLVNATVGAATVNQIVTVQVVIFALNQSN